MFVLNSLNSLNSSILYPRLYLLAHAGYGDVEHLAVLSHRTAGNAVALLVEDVHKVLIRKRVALILVVDTLLQDGLNLVARDLLARGCLHALRE